MKTPLERKCYACKKVKPISEFRKSKAESGGHKYLCRLCDNKRSVEYGAKNPQKRKDTNKRARFKLRAKALIIVGNGKIECVNCGCNKIEIIEINHKEGGGCQEFKKIDGYKFYRKIVSGEREINDLDLRCRVCNALHYIEMKYGSLSFEIVWHQKIISNVT